ncbi:MAG: response regulator [Candidatus Omnitrophica bacterium]|nr:response regulator [Candidatus Omnitrophota bacterium]
MSLKKILIVDDERGFTEMVKLNLEATGYYQVKIENRGTHALSTALKYKPDLILLDVIMPELEGPDVVNQLKRDPDLQDVPVVFLTATVTKEEVDVQGGFIGGHAFIAKPSSLEKLINCVRDHIG